MSKVSTINNPYYIIEAIFSRLNLRLSQKTYPSRNLDAFGYIL